MRMRVTSSYINKLLAPCRNELVTYGLVARICCCVHKGMHETCSHSLCEHSTIAVAIVAQVREVARPRQHRTMSDPFQIKRGCIVIEGGGLKEPWVIDPKMIDDEAFLVMNKWDRKLARAMGLNMYERNPWSVSGAIDALSAMRDAEVDRLIHARQTLDDPLGENNNISPCKLSANREKLYVSCGAPPVVTITHPPFRGAGGVDVGAFTIRVASTPKTGLKLAVEATATALSFLRKLVDARLEEHERAENVGTAELPELLNPVCKWRRLKTKYYVTCTYRSRSGIWHTHRKEPTWSDDQETFVAFVRQAEADVQKYYDENHVEDSEGDVTPRYDEGGEPASHSELNGAS